MDITVGWGDLGFAIAQHMTVDGYKIALFGASLDEKRVAV